MTETYFIGVFLTLICLALIALDLFFIPTALLTVVALISLFSYFLYVYNNVDPAVAWHLFLFFIGAGLLFLFAFFKFKLWQVFAIKQKLAREEAQPKALAVLLGKRGVAFSALRPSGKVAIDGKRYDAVAALGFIPTGSEIEVKGTSGAQLKVIALSKPSAPASPPSGQKEKGA